MVSCFGRHEVCFAFDTCATGFQAPIPWCSSAVVIVFCHERWNPQVEMTAAHSSSTADILHNFASFLERLVLRFIAAVAAYINFSSMNSPVPVPTVTDKIALLIAGKAYSFAWHSCALLLWWVMPSCSDHVKKCPISM
jgi:hypothetical protein